MKLFGGNDATLSNNSVVHKIPDLFYVLLCMFLGEALLRNPLLGLSTGLAVLFWLSCVNIAMRGQIERRGMRILAYIPILLGVGINIALLFVFPESLGTNNTTWLFSLGLVIFLKNFLAMVVSGRNTTHAKRIWQIIGLHVVMLGIYSLLCCLSLSMQYLPTALGGYAVIDIFYTIREIKHPIMRTKYKSHAIKLSSYRLFSEMSLYVSISFYLALFMFMGYIVTLPPENGINPYILILVWISFVGLITFLLYKQLHHTAKSIHIGVFLIGAVAWIFSAYKLFHAISIVDGILWSGFFAAGLACMYTCMYQMSENFKQVSCLIDEDISDDDLMQNTEMTQSIAFAFSAIVLLAVLYLHIFTFKDPYEERVFSTSTILLPFLFIFLSCIMALRQPLDASSLDKLNRVHEGKADAEMTNYLKNILVAKYRKRYGVRIIAFFIKPFIYHKVYGKENVNEEELPAVFVCNHGEIYGPVTAVTHLPYYFRPWSHAKMLTYPEANKHIYDGILSHMKLPKFLKRFLAMVGARLCVWALNSFDPVHVHLGNIRELYKTMQSSVQVLAEGDSLLLFPENPGTHEDGRYAQDSAGSFYTGFAQIGIEYYKKYQKQVTFYPIFASKRKRTFRIGSGTTYNSQNNRHEEKLRIASELQEKMQDLSLL